MGYRRPITRALLCGLLSALVLALWEARGAAASTPGTFMGVLAVALPLLATLATLLALAAGVVFGGVSSILGERWASRAWKTLRDDAARDRRVAGLVVATGVALLVMVLATAVLTAGLGLMDAKRKGVAVLVIGLIAGGVALPLGVAVWFPTAALMLRVSPWLPRVKIPATLAVLLLPLLGLGLVAAKILGGLDVGGLHIGQYLALGAGTLVALVLALVSINVKALNRLVEGKAGLLVGVGLGVLSLGSLLWARGATARDERVRAAVTDHTAATRALVKVVQGLSDHDKDGYPTAVIFGATVDCDDSRALVNPGATEVPDNGLDDNCRNGDAHAEAGAGAGAGAPGPGTPGAGTPGVGTPGAGTPVAGGTPVAKTGAAGFKWDGNVLMIGIDTMRADRLGLAGGKYAGGSLTPAMDALAQRGAWFTGVRAQAPNTPRSFPSIFSSQLPSHVKFDSPTANYGVVLPANQLLFESTTAGGLASFGISSHFYFTEERGITQGATWNNDGAKTVKDSNPDIAAPRVFAKAEAKLRELAQSKQRFAGFVHLFEPHSTYVPHPEYPSKKSGVAGLEERYDMEVRYVDDYVGKLVALLAETGLDKTTAIVLFADHGEAFGDHVFAGERMFFHGQTVFDELLHVPLIIAVPGLEPRKIDEPTMLVDLAPTILDLLKLPIPAEFQGRSLLGAMMGEPLAPRPVLGELLPAKNWPHEARALMQGNLKLIWRPADGVTQLFDLSADPREKTDLSRDRADDTKRLRAELERWLETGTLGAL